MVVQRTGLSLKRRWVKPSPKAAEFSKTMASDAWSLLIRPQKAGKRCSQGWLKAAGSLLGHGRLLLRWELAFEPASLLRLQPASIWFVGLASRMRPSGIG